VNRTLPPAARMSRVMPVREATGYRFQTRKLQLSAQAPRRPFELSVLSHQWSRADAAGPRPSILRPPARPSSVHP